MRFVWFWTFWHWSRESFREGAVLRGPLHSIGSHWDEWFRHEASEADRCAIARTAQTQAGQQEFIRWITDVWAKESEHQENTFVAGFVLTQLAHVQPFESWESLAGYRNGYGIRSVAAVILADGSLGEAADVRSVESILLPPSPDPSSPKVVAEGFRADVAELEEPRRVALDMLGGPGLFVLLALWSAMGRRPYPFWLRVGLTLGWLVAAALILRLLFGAEPGTALPALGAGLLMLVIVLGAVELVFLAWHCHAAWREGRRLVQRLRDGHLRLRMTGGFKIEGGSAGLPFCLNMLLAAGRAGRTDRAESWIWGKFFGRFAAGEAAWSATGVVTLSGFVRSVVLTPKLRACRLHGGIGHMLTPFQRGWRLTSGEDASLAAGAARSSGGIAKEGVAVRPTERAYAAVPLRVWPCLHVAQAVLTIGQLGSRWQAAASMLAVAVLTTVGVGWSDLQAILVPPRPPLVVSPGSPSPYYLWVSIDSSGARHFRAVFESTFWSNRQANFFVHGGANPSVRAEIPLRRLTRHAYGNEEDGVVWIERRRRFLGREYLPGERVGRYTFSYVSKLKYE